MKKQGLMGTVRSYWEPSHFRRVMLTKIGEGIKDYYGTPSGSLPSHVAELLKRLDDPATDERDDGGAAPTTKLK